MLLGEIMQCVVCPALIRNILVEFRDCVFAEMIKEIVNCWAILKFLFDVCAKLCGEHLHGTLTQLGGLLPPRFLTRFLSYREEPEAVVDRLPESAVAHLVIEVVAGVKELNAFRPS